MTVRVGVASVDCQSVFLNVSMTSGAPWSAVADVADAPIGWTITNVGAKILRMLSMKPVPWDRSI